MFNDILIGIAILGILLFPVLYAIYFKLNRKLLFIASCYGLEQIILMLLYGLFSPMIILEMFAVPQLEANQYLENVRWLINGLYFVESYWYIGMFSILLIAPFLVYRRFKDVFITQSNT